MKIFTIISNSVNMKTNKLFKKGPEKREPNNVILWRPSAARKEDPRKRMAGNNQRIALVAATNHLILMERNFRECHFKEP